MISIALLGCGNIGRRHLQSLMDLEARHHELYVLEPDLNMVDLAKATIEAAKTDLPVHFVSADEELPNGIDIAIVATNSLVRRDVSFKLINNHRVRCLILEKFLFPRVEDYSVISDALREHDVVAYVNCPTRIWPLFQALSRECKGRKISKLRYDGIGADIGCNGIHMFDLLSFLAGATEFEIDGFQLLDHGPAKRDGYMRLGGVVSGRFRKGCGSSIPFTINAPEGSYSGGVTNIEFDDGGVIECKESGTKIVVTGSGVPDALALSTWSIPFQSELTAGYGREFLAHGATELPDYETSQKLHLGLLEQYLHALNERSLLQDHQYCPVT